GNARWAAGRSDRIEPAARGLVSTPRWRGRRPRHQPAGVKVPCTSLSLVAAWLWEIVVSEIAAAPAASSESPPPTPVPDRPAAPAAPTIPARKLPPLTPGSPGWASVPEPADPAAPERARFCA